MTIHVRFAGAAPALLCALLLQACGGGGGGSAGTSAPAAGPGVSASSNSVTRSIDASQAMVPPGLVQVSLSSAPGIGLTTHLSWSGTAVAGATFSWTSATAGTLSVNFPPPATVGPGTYMGSVRLDVCMDSACNQPLSGSPQTFAVTYTVTGTLPPPAFTLIPGAVGFESNTANTAAQSTNFTMNVTNVPAAGLYVLLTQPRGGFVTSVSDTQAPVSDGSINVTFTLTLVSPASLGSGYFKSTVTFQVCFDSACTRPIAGSPVVEPIGYTVYLTPGKEYSLQSVNAGGVSDLAWGSADGKLYVSGLAGYGNSFSGAVSQIDPATGAVGTQVPLKDSLPHVAASQDGTYLYAASDTNPLIYRLKLPSLANDLSIPLGSTGDPNLGQGANLAAQMRVAPGAAQTVAVALGHPHSIQTAGTEIFDGAIARPNMLASVGNVQVPDMLAWSDTSSMLYVYRDSYQIPYLEEIDRVAVTSGGLSVQSSIPVNIAQEAVGNIYFAQGRIYDTAGYVRDATSGASVGQFVMPPIEQPPNQIIAMVPDAANGRAFFLVLDWRTGQELLYMFDLATFALKSVAAMPAANQDVAITTHMITWGVDGIAFNGSGNGGVQILAGTFYAAPAAITAKAAGRGPREMLSQRLIRSRLRH